MNSLNSIILEGNVVRNPLIHETPKGTPICTFSLASNRAYRTDSGLDKEVSYFNIETWGKLAELCNQNCPKGRGVRVVGRLKQTRWTDTEGNKQSRIFVVAEHVEFKPKFNKTENLDQAQEAENTTGKFLENENSYESGLQPEEAAFSEREAVTAF